MMKTNIIFFVALILFSCRNEKKVTHTEVILDSNVQVHIFKKIDSLLEGIPQVKAQDSLAFLILPINASCPYCKKKTIEKIAKKHKNIDTSHYIIISANKGLKTIAALFREQGYDLPITSSNIRIDSTNKASEYALCADKPTFYYSTKGKIYKKVASIPYSVKDDLADFFH